MNTKALNSLADLICRAQANGKRTPMGIAMAIDSAQRHMTPETAAELDRLRKYAENRQSREEELLAVMGQYDLINTPDAWALGMTVISHLEGPHRPSTPEELEPGLRRLIEQLRTRVAELEAERHTTNEALSDAAETLRANRDRIAELEHGPALLWAHAMADDDLHGFLGDLVSAAMGRWQSAPEVPDRTVLANVEKACAEWRTPGQGYRSDEAERARTLHEHVIVRDAEIERLKARVAELEAATYVAPSPSCTRCYGADAERFVAKGGTTTPCRVCGPSQVDELQARVAELERQLAAKDRTVDEDPIAYALTDKAVTAVDPWHPCGCPKRFGRHAWGCPTTAVDAASVAAESDGITQRIAPTQALRAELEDPHDSPLHHDYRVGRDLPEVQR